MMLIKNGKSLVIGIEPREWKALRSRGSVQIDLEKTYELFPEDQVPIEKLFIKYTKLLPDYAKHVGKKPEIMQINKKDNLPTG